MRINKKLIKAPKFNNNFHDIISSSQRFITCDFDGRFGNNLFQIGTTISYAYKNKFQSIFPNWKYKEIFDWNLNFDDNERSSKYWNDFRHHTIPYKNIPIKGLLRISGWFQSWKYLEKECILNTFLFKNEILTKIKEKYSAFLGSRITSLHVRRQDYIGDSRYYQVPVSYYNKNIKLLDRETDYFFVFSDDIEWCKSNIHHDKIVYIEGNLDYEDFILMSSWCINNIITNSTFSWWAAYLNKNLHKKVIVPFKWFNNEGVYSKKDMYCNDWIIGEN